MKKIAVLIDFTSVCETALEHAAVIARKALTPLLLVHIAAESDRDREEEIKQRMKEHTAILDQEGIPFLLKVGFGEFFSTSHQNCIHCYCHHKFLACFDPERHYSVS